MPKPDQPSNDAALIQQAVHGDKQAFGLLFENYYEQIFRYMLNRVTSCHEAEDLAETVFLKAWQYLPSFGRRSQARNFRAWLYRIAHNTLIDFRRTRKPGTSFEEEVMDNNAWMNLNNNLEEKQTLVVVNQAIAGLDDTSQHVIITRFFAGMTHKEIAQTLGISEGNARVILFRAIQKIRDILGEDYE